MAWDDTSEVFDFIEEALDEVALPVELGIAGGRFAPAGFGRDVGACAAIFEVLCDGVGIKGLVGQDDAALVQGLEQLAGELEIRGLARGQRQAEGPTGPTDVGVGGRTCSSVGTGFRGPRVGRHAGTVGLGARAVEAGSTPRLREVSPSARGSAAPLGRESGRRRPEGNPCPSLMTARHAASRDRPWPDHGQDERIIELGVRGTRPVERYSSIVG